MADSPLGADAIHELAALCKLELEPREAERMQQELAVVLAWVDQLGSLPLSHAAGAANSKVANWGRDDTPATMLTQEQALSTAPEPRAGAFAVPRVIEG